MKLNKKSRDKIFDLHLGLTFDWRETGLLRWRIFLWMLFFGVCAFAAGLFVHVEVPEIRSRGDQPGAVVLLPADNPRLHQYVLRNTPLPVRGPVWADPVTAGPTGEMGVTLPSPRSADGRIVTAGSLSGFSRSEDHTGLRSDFFVVVDVWGVPSQVLLLESSGSNGADESAMRFARSLRWVPSREPRSGTMSIEWKEEEP